MGTAAQNHLNPGWIYYTLGIAGESGELMEKVKKLFRDKGGVITEEFKGDVIKESGDIIWYIARLLDEMGIDFNIVADTNISKLLDRLDRGKLHGDGDDR
jgi:NTP pyrophosphatase (non-canonical NTP hydrolase)